MMLSERLKVSTRCLSICMYVSCVCMSVSVCSCVCVCVCVCMCVCVCVDDAIREAVFQVKVSRLNPAPPLSHHPPSLPPSPSSLHVRACALSDSSPEGKEEEEECFLTNRARASAFARVHWERESNDGDSEILNPKPYTLHPEP